MPFKPKTYEVVIDKLVHGGQGIGTLSGGKRALVWNVLPGERVRFSTRKSKSSYVEGIADEVLEESADRETPRDEIYLSTSPWQMMSYEAENRYKKEIMIETLQRAGVDTPADVGFYAPETRWRYRNKMEYSFYGDDAGLHLALFNRGTHRKQIVAGSSLAKLEIDRAAGDICKSLSEKNVRASDLKSLIVRSSASGDVAAALFTRDEKFPKITELNNASRGLVVYFSNPKSPASVPTRELYALGDITLEDSIIGVPIKYDAMSFFQVNLDPYEAALKVIREEARGYKITDMYAGTGSIGLSVTDTDLRLIEQDPHSVAMARVNAAGRNVEIIEASSEESIDHIPSGEGQAVIFDPPRAGLHANVTRSVLEKLPEKIIYLSCNPSTFARDLEILQKGYGIASISGYNFFPRTPHIEALAVLQRKN